MEAMVYEKGCIRCGLCAAVYLFGGKAIDYTFYGMCIANVCILLMDSIKPYGLGEFITGFIAFANTHGSQAVGEKFSGIIFGVDNHLAFRVDISPQGISLAERRQPLTEVAHLRH